MQCSDVRKLLPGLALGDVDAEPAREAGDHLESCAECRAEREVLESTVGLLRRCPPAPPSTERRSAAVQAMARAHGELAERLLVRPSRSWTPAAAAAGFFLALLAGAALLLPLPRGGDFGV